MVAIKIETLHENVGRTMESHTIIKPLNITQYVHLYIISSVFPYASTVVMVIHLTI